MHYTFTMTVAYNTEFNFKDIDSVNSAFGNDKLG